MLESTKRTLTTGMVFTLIVFALGRFAQPAEAQLRTLSSSITTTVFSPPPPPPANLDQSFVKPQPWSTEMTYERGWTGENPRMLADVNGDGKQDLVGFGYDGVWLATSTGTQFNAAFVLADFGYQSGWRSE